MPANRVHGLQKILIQNGNNIAYKPFASAKFLYWKSKIMEKPLTVLGGLLAITSLLLAWWCSYYTSGGFSSIKPMIYFLTNANQFPTQFAYNVSPIYFAGSPGVQLNQTTLWVTMESSRTTSPPLVLLSVVLVLLGGLTAVASGIFARKTAAYDIISGAAVLLAIIMFLFAITKTAGLWALVGIQSALGVWAYWGPGPGLLVALASALLMTLNRKLGSRTRNTSTTPT